MSSDEAPSEHEFGDGEDWPDESASSEEDEEVRTGGPSLDDMSFEDRAKLMADGFGGRAGSGASASTAGKAPEQRGTKRKAEAVEEPHKRLDKNAPVEMKISKRPVDVLRDAVQRKAYHRRDPRFVSSGAPGDERSDRKRYAFLFNEKIPEEVRDLKAQLKSEKDGGARKRIQARMTRLQQSVRLEQDRRIDDEVDVEWKKREKAAVGEGKNLYHLKASDRKKLVLEKKYEQLQKTGKLEAYMAKRRKRNASKDHRKMPARS